MPQHSGAEERPTVAYFAVARPKEHSQGNIYKNAPYVMPASAGRSLTIVARDVMLVTRSCDLDYGPAAVQIAPVVDVGTRVTPLQIDDIRKYDCFHDVMYLPTEGGVLERLVNFGAIQSIGMDTLARCERIAMLTYTATQQLQRKLAIHWTGLHIPREEFRPPSDDFST